MTREFILLENPQLPTVIQALEALNQGRFDPEPGHRTRPGLSPTASIKDLIHHRQPMETVCLTGDDTGLVMAVKRAQGSICPWNHRELETFEATTARGYPHDDLYRKAHDHLFQDTPQDPIPEETPLYGPGYRRASPHGVPLHGALYRDPRPVPGGWAMTLWHTNHRPETASSHRIVVRRYEDTLHPDICNHLSHPAYLRPAEPGE